MPGHPTQKLTGNTRYRTSWFGKLILQVEEDRWNTEILKDPTGPKTQWRDALEHDLLALSNAKRMREPPSGGSSGRKMHLPPRTAPDFPPGSYSWAHKVRDLKKSIWQNHAREPNLEEMLTLAATHIMLPDVIDEQRKSWARGMGPCEHGIFDFEECPECREKALKAYPPPPKK